ncbi:IclR family transcriptional regulator [Streptomyces sp. NPDC005953]|uniref:IclR family transcriptional regulator n=1 Tax=Streptomyces sp. NPDC005953 TaxID=3156719 RepID=UPI0033EE55D7
MQGIQRALRILEVVATHQPIGVGEISRISDVPKSSVQRVLRALADAGWIRTDGEEHTRWMLTSRMLHLAGTASGERGIREVALGPMRELGERTGETVTLQVPDGPFRMVLIERIDCRHPVRTVNRLGATSPITATSTGLAVLALMTDEKAERVLAQPVRQLTANTITEPRLIRAELREVRSRGFAVNRGQNRDGVCAVGAAVMGPTSAPVGGIGLSLPESRFDARRVPWWSQQVRIAAANVAAALAE